MQNPELFACLSKERKENLLGTLLFRPSIYERLYYEEEMVRKQIVRNPQIRAAAPPMPEKTKISARTKKPCLEHYTQSRAISAKFRFPRCWTPTSTG